MSDIQMLVDMGFPKERAERALQLTNNKGVEPAMEWLLAHADEPIDVQPGEASAPPAEGSSSVPATDDGTVVDADVEAKSLKCDECGRLFKNQMEVEFHAAKSGHASFSESTEEKKPLTEEERKQQLALLEAKIKQKRLEREEAEKKDAAEKERLRIKSGKDMLEAKARIEELEMKKIMDQRKREKAEEKAARDRVKAMIEADKAARKAKMSGELPPDPTQCLTPNAKASVSPVVSSSSSNTPSKPKEYTSTKIQIRLQDGSALTETFDAKEQLSAVRLFVQLRQGSDLPFGLMTSFPRKVFNEEDYEKPLDILGLVPSAVIIVTKAQ